MRVLDALLPGLVMVVAILVYHIMVVVPIENECGGAIKDVYVVDLDAVINEARQNAVLSAVKGERVSSQQVTNDIRRRLSAFLSGLPPEALVLDKSAVLKGGRMAGVPVSTSGE